MKKFKRQRDYSFFDQDIRLSKLNQLGDPLEKLKSGVDFEIFRALLEERLIKKAKGAGGRPAYDYVLMFKILILQRYYNLSDEQLEYQINDRMSFMRFLELTLADDIPDSRTIWAFNERLTDLGLARELLDLFESHLEALHLVAHEGKLVDASFVEAPRQRNTREENAEIKEGAIPEKWKETPSKLAQKDVDARWTKKNNVSYYGYKNHTKVDHNSKLVTQYKVTDASVHDSQALNDLLDEQDKSQTIHADSAYTAQQKILDKYQVEGQICEKGVRGKPLTEAQKESNRQKSKTRRARVEHVFGFMEKSMGSMFYRKIGIKRAETVIGLMNLTYNMFRKLQLDRISAS